jgi:hypothetical protein
VDGGVVAVRLVDPHCHLPSVVTQCGALTRKERSDLQSGSGLRLLLN